jgi:hypothetical protein
LRRRRPPHSQVRRPNDREIDGEDIGQSQGALSLNRVRHGMQQAENLLNEPAEPQVIAAKKAVAVQHQVVSELDKLIAELSKQCQGGQCKPAEAPSKPSQRSQAKPTKSDSAVARGPVAARDSTDRLDRSNAKAVDKGEIRDVVKDLWGHFPARSREQMMQSFSDEFLPKYELEIEAYYRRLSEERENGQR